MKYLLVTCISIFFFQAVQAQATPKTDSLAEYTGKFKFPEGNPVTEINVTLENGTLMAGSALGTAELQKTDNKDVFDIVSFSGIATFKRNADGKINVLRVQVQDLDMEGTKVEEKGWVLTALKK